MLLQLHFGVNSGATKFAIERQAVNEATFRCPDELGWKPQVALLLCNLTSILQYSWGFLFSYIYIYINYNLSSLLTNRKNIKRKFADEDLTKFFLFSFPFQQTPIVSEDGGISRAREVVYDLFQFFYLDS